MKPKWRRLPVEKFTERALWATLNGRLASIEQQAAAWPGREGILYNARDAQACALELKVRGTQLSLAGELCPFPRELPQVAQMRLPDSRA